MVDDHLITADGTVLAAVTEMRRAFVHDRTNALAAATAALAVGATPAGVREALANYTTLPHRVALVGEAIGVRWYDDSKATNPDATLRALESFDSVVLLAGGRNKGLDLRVLARAADRLRGVVAFGEAGAEVAAALPRFGARRDCRFDARRRARRRRPGRAGRRGVAVARVRVVRRVRQLRRARRRLRRGSPHSQPRWSARTMTVVTPRLRLPRLNRDSHIARVRDDVVRRHRALPRPASYVVLCATVAVLNIVGLVMILSASSVAALSDYGSSWYFFDRQLMWAVFGLIAFVAASTIDYHRWRRWAPLVLVVALIGLVVVLVPGVGITVNGSRRWLGVGMFRVQPSEVAKLALLCLRRERARAPLGTALRLAGVDARAHPAGRARAWS